MTGLLRGNLQTVAPALLNFCFAVAELDAAADAVEQTRCDGHVAFRGEAVGHRADVPVHAEDFLRDHHGAARRFAGRGEPGIELVAIARHERGELTHGAAPETSGFDEKMTLCHQWGGCPLSRRYYRPSFVGRFRCKPAFSWH